MKPMPCECVSKQTHQNHLLWFGQNSHNICEHLNAFVEFLSAIIVILFWNMVNANFGVVQK
jgi:hypothetical protein